MQTLFLVFAFCGLLGVEAQRKLIDQDFIDPRDHSISCGTNHICLIEGLHQGSLSGEISCWDSQQNVKEDTPQGLQAVMLSSGRHHTCAIDRDGQVSCWGKCCTHSPQGKFSQVCSGSGFSCALSEVGKSVLCWGQNDKNQIAVPEDLHSSHNGNIVQLTCGTSHVCALADNGTVECWGDNRFNQADTKTFSSGGVQLVQISAGDTHTVGLTTDHDVVCWGSNSNHQCNLVQDKRKFAQVVAGIRYTCGVTEDAPELVCVGQTNSISQDLRRDSQAGKHFQFKTLSPGPRHVCGTVSENQIHCLGIPDPPVTKTNGEKEEAMNFEEL